MIPQPSDDLSILNGEAYPSLINWLSGNESSILVSEIIKISLLFLIISVKASNLFLRELIFMWPIEIRFTLFSLHVFRIIWGSIHTSILET